MPPPHSLTPALLAALADRFKALAEPARLSILNCLRKGEMSVGDLVEKTGLGQANVSRHLQVLNTMGFVRRRKEGLFVYYALSDHSVFQLCDIMCSHIESETKARAKIIAV
ncbi:MAG: metalloregulator ArsR/SmtB family transcription factor [bacterium]